MRTSPGEMIAGLQQLHQHRSEAKREQLAALERERTALESLSALYGPTRDVGDRVCGCASPGRFVPSGRRSSAEPAGITTGEHHHKPDESEKAYSGQPAAPRCLSDPETRDRAGPVVLLERLSVTLGRIGLDGVAGAISRVSIVANLGHRGLGRLTSAPLAIAI